MILIMAAYDQDISVAFIDDGVYALKKGQNTEDIEIKGFAKTVQPCTAEKAMHAGALCSIINLKVAKSLLPPILL